MCLAIASAFAIRRLSFDTDVLSLLPRDGTVVPAFRTFVERFGSVDDLYVVLTAPAGHEVGDYQAEIDRWSERLRQTPGITRVDTGMVSESRDLTYLSDRRLLLLSGERLETAIDRFSGEGLTHAIRSSRSLLTVPSPAVTNMVRHDPLGLFSLLRDELGAAQAGVNLGVTEGGYISNDGRSRLLIAKPSEPPFDAEFSRGLMASLDALRAEMAATSAGASDPAAGGEERPPLQVEFAGGHRIAVETESVIRRESVLNTVGSLALILPVLFLVFRSGWLVVVGAIPSAMSLLFVLGLVGMGATTLSAAATASSAMLFGLGIDGVVLLYVAYTLSVRDGIEPAAAIDGLGGPASSMLLGMWTTAATFYGLEFVDFPSLEQLGMLIGHSMVLCGLLTLVLVPALLPLRRPRRAQRSLSMRSFAHWIERRSSAILLAAIVMTVVLALASTRLSVDPTLDRLRSVTPGAELLQRIAPMFGLPEDVYIVLSSGTDLEPLLAADERLRQDLARELPNLNVQAASALLPPGRSQRERRALIDARAIAPASAAAALAKAETTEGFRAGSFDPFRERLPELLDSGQRLTYEGYRSHGLDDLISRFVTKDGDRWLLATYILPTRPEDVHGLSKRVRAIDPNATLTGLPLVNEELAGRFLPEFVKGLSIGTIVVVALVLLAFRNWRLSLLSLVPTAVGLVWAAGALAIAGVPLDLFALFAVVTFVGIGVDYGVHMVHRYQERGDATSAVSELAPVILVAAAITLLGYGTLVTSSYPPLRSIGIVSAFSVVTLAAASLFVLPAILSRARRGNSSPEPPPSELRAPRRWTLHGLNNGLIFTATFHGVRLLPRAVSYAIGYVGTWIAWKTMHSTRAAVAQNLSAVFPDEPNAMLERRALVTLRSYARDVIDFLRALSHVKSDPQVVFDIVEEHRILFTNLLAQGRGVILVSGHYGNWEVGSMLISRALDLPLTIVAMSEANPTVNRIRLDIRQKLGADTIEVRQSFDTALQIRRCLADNRIVAMLVDRHFAKDRVPVTFFGRSAWMLRTPFLMAHATGAPLLPCAIERIGPGRFKARPGAPVFVATDLPRDEALARAAQEVANAIETCVREHPEYWYHFYRYWDAQRDDYRGLA